MTDNYFPSTKKNPFRSEFGQNFFVRMNTVTIGCRVGFCLECLFPVLQVWVIHAILMRQITKLQMIERSNWRNKRENINGNVI